jgi:hypothetical protein
MKTFLVVHARGRRRHPGATPGASIMANAVCENGPKRILVDSALRSFSLTSGGIARAAFEIIA